MDLYIIEDDVIQNIQKCFSETYPHLKLQFYKNPHGQGQSSPDCDRLSSKLPVEDAAIFHTSGRINIDPDRTVAELEHDFFHNMGLSVQVFRQSGSVWLETVNTDNWTLAQQEQKAIESLMPPALPETEDMGLSDVS